MVTSFAPPRVNTQSHGTSAKVPLILVYGSDIEIQRLNDAIDSLNRSGLNIDVCTLQFDKGFEGLRLETGEMGKPEISRKSFDFSKADHTFSLRAMLRGYSGTGVKLSKDEVEEVLSLVVPDGAAKFNGKEHPSVEQIMADSEYLYNAYFD
jgi:hypothetical protein